MSTVLPRMEEADSVAPRIPQVGFTPKPGLILRPGLELKTSSSEPSHCGVKILDLEINDDAVIRRHTGCSVQ
jgi:hypothetical protein